MANRGWSSSGGESVDSTTRQSGVKTNTSAADGFVQGSKIAHPSGGDSDPLGSPADRFEAPGQLSAS